MNVVTKQAVGFVGAFTALFLVVGAGIVLVLNTFAGATDEFRVTAPAIVLGLVIVSVALLSAVAVASQDTVSNPYWSLR
jgi:hypothetical protein